MSSSGVARQTRSGRNGGASGGGRKRTAKEAADRESLELFLLDVERSEIDDPYRLSDPGRWPRCRGRPKSPVPTSPARGTRSRSLSRSRSSAEAEDAGDGDAGEGKGQGGGGGGGGGAGAVFDLTSAAVGDGAAPAAAAALAPCTPPRGRGSARRPAAAAAAAAAASHGDGEADGAEGDAAAEVLCPSVLRWEAEAARKREQGDAAAAKRGRKKKGGRRRKKGDDGDGREGSPGKQKHRFPRCHPWLKRPDKAECACDGNPFCMASIGIVPGDTFPEDDEPSGDDSRCESEKYGEGLGFRRTAYVTAESIRKHLEGFVLPDAMPADEKERTCREYLEQIQSYHRVLMMTDPTPEEEKDEEGALTDGPRSEEKVAVSVPPGMENLGATCYLNSQLQCLAQNLAFRQGVFSWRPESSAPDPAPGGSDAAAADDGASKNDERMRTIYSQMQTLLARMNFAGKNIVSTAEFARSLGLDDEEMQDPNEFARLLFDRMNEMFQLGGGGGGQGEDAGDGIRKLLPRIFSGRCEYVTTCGSCGYASHRSEDFTELSLPIVPSSAGPSSQRGGGGTDSAGGNVDTDVQACLSAYLSPEYLTGDNQYYCERCSAKRDATRVIRLSHVPPVINIQLSRYVFDMVLLLKKKVEDRVLLPRVIRVPTAPSSCSFGGANEVPSSFSEESSSEYVLCGVLNHQGTSAYGGHYIAEAMDWTTGLWYQFNDDDVNLESSGPMHSFFPDSTSTICSESLTAPECPRGEGQKGWSTGEVTESRMRSKNMVGNNKNLTNRSEIQGSTDAYSLLYVERSYLASHATKEILMGNDKTNDEFKIIRDCMVEERLNHQLVIDDLRRHAEEVESQLLVRRLGIENMFRLSMDQHGAPSYSGGPCDISEWCPIVPAEDDCVWVDSASLRSFMRLPFLRTEDRPRGSNTDESAVASLLDPRQSLCEHSVGLHPQTARRGKLVRKATYEALKELLLSARAAKEDGIGDAGKPVEQEFVITVKSNLRCPSCADSYSRELRQKMDVLRMVVRLYDALDPALGDEEVNKCNGYYLSRKFISEFRRLATKKMKKVLSDIHDEKNVGAAPLDLCTFDDLLIPPHGVFGGQDMADLSKGDGANARDEGEPKESSVQLDRLVNLRITCPHGNVSSSANNSRTAKTVSQETWDMVLSLYPDAITHKRVVAPDSDDCNVTESCVKCQREKDEDESLRLWATDTLSSPKCKAVYNRAKQGFPEMLCNADFHSTYIQKYSQDFIFHFVRRESILKWREMVSALVEKNSVTKLRGIIEETNTANGQLPAVGNRAIGGNDGVVKYRCEHDRLIIPDRMMFALQGAFVGSFDKCGDGVDESELPCELITHTELDEISVSLTALGKVVGSLSESSLFSALRAPVNSFATVTVTSKNSCPGTAQMPCVEGRTGSSTICSNAEVEREHVFAPSLCQSCTFEVEYTKGGDTSPKCVDERCYLVIHELKPSDNIPFIESIKSKEETALQPGGKNNEACSKGRQGGKRTLRSKTRKQDEIAISCGETLAKLRLLLYQEFGYSPVGQELILAKTMSVLPFKSNRDLLSELGILNEDRIYVRYPSDDAANGTKRSKPRKTYQQRREESSHKQQLEDAMVESLIEADAAAARRTGVGQRNNNAERGFEGTFLQSAGARAPTIDVGQQQPEVHEEEVAAMRGNCSNVIVIDDDVPVNTF